jgi:hypothetical protein
MVNIQESFRAEGFSVVISKRSAKFEYKNS